MQEMITESVECCPHCSSENIYPCYNVEKDGYITRCQHCGEEICLCDECLHADDNPNMYCNWRESIPGDGYSYGICFRGITKHESKDVI